MGFILYILHLHIQDPVRVWSPDPDHDPEPGDCRITTAGVVGALPTRQRPLLTPLLPVEALGPRLGPLLLLLPQLGVGLDPRRPPGRRGAAGRLGIVDPGLLLPPLLPVEALGPHLGPLVVLLPQPGAGLDPGRSPGRRGAAGRPGAVDPGLLLPPLLPVEALGPHLGPLVVLLPQPGAGLDPGRSPGRRGAAGRPGAVDPGPPLWRLSLLLLRGGRLCLNLARVTNLCASQESKVVTMYRNLCSGTIS